MIVIEFGGNTLTENTQAANTLQKPEKPARSSSSENRLGSQAEITETLATSQPEHQPNHHFFVLLRTWIEQNILKLLGF